MSPFLIMGIIVGTLAIDYMWLDYNRKRWGWMKSLSRKFKVMYLACFLTISCLIYIGMSGNYF
ncbi:hypothetical protein ACNRWW_03865 [Metabacillus sp. HB246100]|uniref:hypothetical protein n=1 Tax=Bacillus weihaiensis TaxID=1547283 RepID=UPI002352D2F4|nr:hypothetical protein [Bacillus weihaiensis]